MLETAKSYHRSGDDSEPDNVESTGRVNLVALLIAAWSGIAGAAGPAPQRHVDGSTAFQVVTRSDGGCQAMAPADWLMQAGAQQSGLDLWNPSRTLAVSYLVYPVNTAIGPYAGAYAPPMNDPDLHSPDPRRVIRAMLRYMVGRYGGAPDLELTADPPEVSPPYTVVTYRGSTHSGVAVYAAFPGLDPRTYVLPFRVAVMANRYWPEKAGGLAQIALSIRCVTRLRAPPDADVESRVVRSRPRGASGKGRSKEGDEAGYNPWRGSEWVHDPKTGDNFNVTASHWSNTGPDGPGYYKRNGNDITKLVPGRSP